MNIKLFDYGPVPDRFYGKNSDATIYCRPIRDAPERGGMFAQLEVWVCVAPKVKSPNNLAYYCAGYVSPKSDVYVFIMLLVELITKTEFDYSFFYTKECRKENWLMKASKKIFKLGLGSQT
ncbi:hypothetical protein FXO37_17651 [Capsicum annuum]|nr:hypothetical protein FXO37_17651 [Capsicum annuum]